MTKTKTNKKISISAFEKIMKDTHTATKNVEWNGVEITIKHTLPFKDFLTFVDSVVKSCFSIDNNSYLPEIKDFSIRCCVLEMYANFAMPVNVERRYDLVYCTDAVDVVMSEINMAQFNVIEESISAKIDNIAQANIEAINKQMTEVYSAFENIQNQMAGIFDGVGNGEMSKLIEAISGDAFDENKLVQAYIDQTNINTDIKVDTEESDSKEGEE